MTRLTPNLNTLILLLTIIAAIVSPVLYIGEIKTSVATQSTEIANIKRELDELADIKKDIREQGRDLATIKGYFDNGILRRLQLENLKRVDISEETAIKLP